MKSSKNTSRLPFVSVIMNCFNGEEFLQEAIESVLAQTFQDWEIVFWDNQSTDKSARIANSIRDDRIRYFYADKHTPLGEARNLAVNQAIGQWLAFLDCDDVWTAEKLERQVAVILEEGSELGLVYGRMRVLLSGQAKNTKWGKKMQRGASHEVLLPEGDIFSSLVKWNFIPLLSSIVRRSAYAAVKGIDPELKQAEDYDLFLKICRSYKARAIQEVICSYRIHGSNLTHDQMQENSEEAILVVSRYLPSPEAKQGVRSHHTLIAVDEIIRGQWARGVRRLFSKGDLVFLIGKVTKSVFRSLRRLWFHISLGDKAKRKHIY